MHHRMENYYCVLRILNGAKHLSVPGQKRRLLTQTLFCQKHSLKLSQGPEIITGLDGYLIGSPIRAHYGRQPYLKLPEIKTGLAWTSIIPESFTKSYLKCSGPSKPPEQHSYRRLCHWLIACSTIMWRACFLSRASG